MKNTKKAEPLMIQSTLIEKSYEKTIVVKQDNDVNDNLLFFDKKNDLSYNNDTCVNVFELIKFVQKLGCNFPQKLIMFLPVMQFMVTFFNKYYLKKIFLSQFTEVF